MATKETKKTTVKKASAKAKAEVIEAVDAVEEAVETAVETATETVLTKANKNFAAAQDIAKQVWFAYLGAAGRTYDEVVSRYSKAGEELQVRFSKLKQDRQELIADLVTRGEKVQDDAEARLKEGRATIEEQIEVAKERFAGMSSVVDVSGRLQDLSDKLESLSKDLKKTA